MPEKQQSLFDTGSSSSTNIYVSVEDAKPLARRTDPETSHSAAAIVATELKGLKKLFVETLRKLKGRRTANEVAAEAYPFTEELSVAEILKKRETLRKRGREIVNMKNSPIRESGRIVCPVNLNEAASFEVVKQK